MADENGVLPAPEHLAEEGQASGELIAERDRLAQEVQTLQGQAAARAAVERTASEELERMRQELEGAQSAGMRLRVAYAQGLPLDLADRLVGGSAEELEADAARLVQLMRPTGGPGVPPPPTATRLKTDLNVLSPEQIRTRRSELWKAMS